MSEVRFVWVYQHNYISNLHMKMNALNDQDLREIISNMQVYSDNCWDKYCNVPYMTHLTTDRQTRPVTVFNV